MKNQHSATPITPFLLQKISNPSVTTWQLPLKEEHKRNEQFCPLFLKRGGWKRGWFINPSIPRTSSQPLSHYVTAPLKEEHKRNEQLCFLFLKGDTPIYREEGFQPLSPTEISLWKGQTEEHKRKKNKKIERVSTLSIYIS